MRGATFCIVVAATALVTGCANGNSGLTSPSPLPAATPSVPSSCAVPAVPRNLSASVTGDNVTLSWSPVGDATDYVVIVGNTPASSDTLMTGTSETYYSVEEMNPGTHFARVHAHNWCGSSEASQPVEFTTRS